MPAPYPTYHVGDRVIVRQWDDMMEECFTLRLYPRVRICYRLPLLDHRASCRLSISTQIR